MHLVAARGLDGPGRRVVAVLDLRARARPEPERPNQCLDTALHGRVADASSRSISREAAAERRKLEQGELFLVEPAEPADAEVPSRLVPQPRQCRRVTASSFEQTGQVAHHVP